MSQANPDAVTTVGVTGAAGYIGSHVVKLLLERGYRVRGVVRDASNTNKVGHLHTLVADPAHPLELFSADLLEPGSHVEAFQGCDAVCHLASPVRLAARDPQREIVDVAVRGTRHVLDSVRQVGGVRRVVLTSSIAAVTDDEQPAEHLFTEADWNDSATLKSPYPLSKTLAERAAWDFQGQLPEDERFELVALNPSVVLGPVFARVHLKSSPATLRDLMTRKMPACPRFYFSLVDVRDVAAAHVAALERPEAQGRHILHAGGMWMQEMARTIAPRFPQFPVPTGRLPDVALYAAALFDKRLTWGFLRHMLGRTTRLDNRKSREELGVEYRDLEQTLVDTCQAFIDHGAVKPR